MNGKKRILRFISIHRDEIFMSLVLSFIYSWVVLITHATISELPNGIFYYVISIVLYILEFLMYLMGLIYIFGD